MSSRRTNPLLGLLSLCKSLKYPNALEILVIFCLLLSHCVFWLTYRIKQCYTNVGSGSISPFRYKVYLSHQFLLLYIRYGVYFV